MDCRTPLERIMNSYPNKRPEVTIRHNRGDTGSNNSGARSSKKAILTYHSCKYDLLSNLAYAPSLLTLCQLGRGDVMEAKK